MGRLLSNGFMYAIYGMANIDFIFCYSYSPTGFNSKTRSGKQLLFSVSISVSLPRLMERNLNAELTRGAYPQYSVITVFVKCYENDDIMNGYCLSNVMLNYFQNKN